MSYKEKPQLKLYAFSNNEFVLQAIIDDYQECSFEHNLYQAGVFTITINYNIPNALLFQRGLFIQFGSDQYDFGEITTIQDSIGADGKGSQIRTITGYDARYLLKRRVIKNMNSNGLWVMTAKGELCLRNLIKDQCGISAEEKRRLPITNVIPAEVDAIGKVYSVSEQFTNLYEVCKTIATQSEIGWRIRFDGSLTLEVYQGENKSQTVQFSTNFDSLSNGEFSDSSESYSNAIYVGGKGQNDDRDIYEGEDGTPSGLDRFESWDNKSQMTTEAEYEAEAISMLTQYGQTIQMAGNGLAKCPYIYKEQYNVGDWITVAFSGKSAVVQILSVTEHWAWGAYDIQFSFGKPQNNLAEQLQLMLRKIQSASEKASSTDSVRWYTLPTDSVMPKADVTYNTIGFVGDVGSGATFTLYLDNEKTGAKTYHIWFKQLGGSGKLTLTTGKQGAVNLTMGVGTYVAIISVDEAGNVVNVASTPTNTIAVGNNQPATSGGVAQAIEPLQPVDTVASGNLHSVTSNAVYHKTVQYIGNAQGMTLTEIYNTYCLQNAVIYKGWIDRQDSRCPSFGTGYTVEITCIDFNLTAIAIDGRKFYYTLQDGWIECILGKRATIVNAIIPSSLSFEWSNVEYRNGVFCLSARINQSSAVTISDGATIGTLRQDLIPPSTMVLNVYNFVNGQHYLLIFNTDGTIKIYGIGTQTITFDIYLNVTYVK